MFVFVQLPCSTPTLPPLLGPERKSPETDISPAFENRSTVAKINDCTIKEKRGGREEEIWMEDIKVQNYGARIKKSLSDMMLLI